MPGGFASIGHSNRDPVEFVGMLRESGVRLLIDVRAFPASRSNPGYNAAALANRLAPFQIGYRHIRALGGRRPRQPEVDPSINALWRVQSFHNYADYALGDAFAEALAEVETLGREQQVALMCAEAVWWRCHRRIIVDYLLAHGHAVSHLMAPGRSEPARLTPGAEKIARGRIAYPAPA